MSNYFQLQYLFGIILKIPMRSVMRQDKVNYAVSEREDRVINRCDDNKRMTSCTGMYRAATGLY